MRRDRTHQDVWMLADLLATHGTRMCGGELAAPRNRHGVRTSDGAPYVVGSRGTFTLSVRPMAGSWNPIGWIPVPSSERGQPGSQRLGGPLLAHAPVCEVLIAHYLASGRAHVQPKAPA
jgi:hypothetical protein